jgi:hypothetical protein
MIENGCAKTCISGLSWKSYFGTPANYLVVKAITLLSVVVRKSEQVIFDTKLTWAMTTVTRLSL